MDSMGSNTIFSRKDVKKMDVGIVISVFVLGGFIGLAIWGRYDEKKMWNNGRCSCGGYWDYFDSSSQG